MICQWTYSTPTDGDRWVWQLQSMQWCCPDREAESLFQEEQRQAMYVSSLDNNPKGKDSQGPPRPMTRSLGEYPYPAQNATPLLPTRQALPPQNYLVSHHLFPSSIQAAQSRNLELFRANQQRKIFLWKRTGTLLDRASALRQEYGAKSGELNELVTQIDQHFG